MLTGLPNRRYFFERLESVVSENQGANKIAVLYIDLDGFKTINDTYGHQIGDKVLVAVGSRLAESISESDFAARLGGDEFAIIASNIQNYASAQQFAANVQTVLQSTVYMENIAYSVKASIGLAVYPDEGADSETLLRKADAAMYEAKRNSKEGETTSNLRTDT